MTTLTVDQIYQTAAADMKTGRSRDQVERKLMEQGLDPDSAKTVVSQLKKAFKSAYLKNGFELILRGIGLFILGLIVSAVSYQMAGSGGTYVIATGAFAVGVINCIRGLWSLGKSVF